MTSFYKGILSSQVHILYFKTVSYRWHNFTREFSLHKSVSYVLKPYFNDDMILQVEFPIQQDSQFLASPTLQYLLWDA